MLPDVFSNCVLIINLFPEQHNVTLWGQVTAEDAVARNENGCTFNGSFVLANGTDIKRNEDGPND